MAKPSTFISARRGPFQAVALAAASAFAGLVLGQANDKMTPIAIPDQPSATPIGTGPLPGATAQESWHSQYGSQFARNVTVATITPFLPDRAKASGAAVVVAPGGGFRTLSMENEGWDVARALAERGVAAFVLKYRLNQTPADMAGFERSMAEMFSSTAARPPRPDPQERMARLAPQIADSRAAFAMIRRRAAEWKIDPDRIGMVGFSAGAMLTMATALVGEDAKPGVHRQHLRSPGCGDRPGRRSAPVRSTRRRRSLLREWRYRVDRQLACGQEAGRVPPL